MTEPGRMSTSSPPRAWPGANFGPPGEAAKDRPAAEGTSRAGTSPQPSVTADLLPSVVAPKGGGAIKGLDETFTVNAATGTGSAAVKLPLSAGRSGFTPALSLQYDSASGNGPFGFGWSLPVPAITRKTD